MSNSWLYIYKISIVDFSGSGKANALLNLIIHQPGIDKTCLYPKDPYEVKTNYLLTSTEVKT